MRGDLNAARHVSTITTTTITTNTTTSTTIYVVSSRSLYKILQGYDSTATAARY